MFRNASSFYSRYNIVFSSIFHTIYIFKYDIIYIYNNNIIETAPGPCWALANYSYCVNRTASPNSSID